MIPISKPYLGEEEARAAQEAVLSGWVTQGPKVAEFERRVAEYSGAAHGVAVTSCTTGLHMALLALDIGPGDEVICPSMSFIATANVIRHTGATPVFADVDRQTYNLDVAAVAAAITPRTKAILLVHQIGLPADIDAFTALGARHGLPIIEDAACAIGSRYQGKPVGAHGAMVVFSFHPRKVITTGEGGMITTNDSRLAERLRLLRQHGMSVSDTARHGAQRVVIEEYLCVGYNYRMTDIQGAIGIEQMNKLEWILERRQNLAAQYNAAFADHPWVRPPFVPQYAGHNYQSYAVQLCESAPLGRNDLMQFLLDRKIATRRGVMLAHRELPYVGLPHANLESSEWASDHSLLLPLYPQMADADVSRVVDAIDAAGRVACGGIGA